MKGVRQSNPTNCVSASIASLFELPLSLVPDFDPYKWSEQVSDWLYRRGYGMVNMTIPEGFTMPVGEPKGYVLGGYDPKPGSDIGHSVVCKDGWVVFDPAKGDITEKIRPDAYTIIYPLDVTARPIRFGALEKPEPMYNSDIWVPPCG